MQTKNKTWKRELATGMILFLGYLALVGSIEALAILTPPVFIFVLGAFGMEWASRQTGLVERKG